MPAHLVMPFFTDSPEFAHGFECGQIWEMLGRAVTIAALPIRKANHAQIQLMCVELGLHCTIEPVDETWCLLTVEDAV